MKQIVVAAKIVEIAGKLMLFERKLLKFRKMNVVTIKIVEI
jgi:hypothetical protein